jgi:hypothetical protein
MTEIRRVICDCCNEEQKLYDGWLPTFTSLVGGGFKYEDRPTHLCHNCAKMVFDFIKQRKKMVKDEIEESGLLS